MEVAEAVGVAVVVVDALVRRVNFVFQLHIDINAKLSLVIVP